MATMLLFTSLQSSTRSYANERCAGNIITVSWPLRLIDEPPRRGLRDTSSCLCSLVALITHLLDTADVINDSPIYELLR